MPSLWHGGNNSPIGRLIVPVHENKKGYGVGTQGLDSREAEATVLFRPLYYSTACGESLL